MRSSRPSSPELTRAASATRFPMRIARRRRVRAGSAFRMTRSSISLIETALSVTAPGSPSLCRRLMAAIRREGSGSRPSWSTGACSTLSCRRRWSASLPRVIAAFETSVWAWRLRGGEENRAEQVRRPARRGPFADRFPQDPEHLAGHLGEFVGTQPEHALPVGHSVGCRVGHRVRIKSMPTLDPGTCHDNTARNRQ
jgi:hypothetical protein